MTKSAANDRVGSEPYQLFMLALCGFALAFLAANTFVRWDESTRTILTYADDAVCGLFLVDFCISLARAPRKWQYFRTWGWIDLLSSVPSVDFLRIGRAARITRILRVLRGIKSARAMAHFLVKRRAESAFLASVLLALLLVICCSIAVLEFEREAGGNIVTAEDAIWWAVSTMTTVGYGDRFPITSEGRMVAMFLMAAGVGVFGVLSGLVASWFLSPDIEEADADIIEVRNMLIEIRARLDAAAATNVPARPSETRVDAPQG